MAAENRNVRDDFAELLTSDDRNDIVSSLKEFVTAGKLTRFECDKCGHENRVPTPDAKLRLDTLKWMTDQGLGALLKEAPRTPVDALKAQSDRDWELLTDDELFLLGLDANDGKLPDLGAGALAVARRVVAAHEPPVATPKPPKPAKSRGRSGAKQA